MRYFLTGLFATLFISVKAQNLIPNPGFELYNGNELAFWQHPDTPYYHHVIAPEYAHSGNAFHSICFSNGRLLNEQLGIQLEEKLKAGKKYLIRFNYVYNTFYGSLDGNINEIHCGFLPQKVSKIDSAFLSKNPMEVLRLKFKVNEVKNSKWNQAELEYIAKGDESYFMIGYFKNFNAAKKPKDWLKPSPLKSIRDNRLEIERKIAQEKNENTFGLMRFRVRFSFDDFCIAEMKEDSLYCPCPLKAKINLDNLQFESKSAILIPGPSSKLDSLIGVLRKSFWEKMTITGYTDNTGSDQTNINLSADRAKTVYNYMLSKGIDKNKIKFRGMGKANPIASNENEEGKKKNRRVEILIE